MNNRLKELNYKFFKASTFGNIKEVKLLLEEGARIDAVNSSGETPLHPAAFYGNVNVVKYLIEKGAGINVTNYYGFTPLQLATMCENPRQQEVIMFLLERGANIEVSKLLKVAFHGFVEVIKYLIRKGEKIDVTDNNGDTLMHQAASGGQLEVIELLRENGLSIYSINKHGDGLLHCAAKNRQFKVVEYLIRKGMDIHAINVEKDTPLHLAIRQTRSYVEEAEKVRQLEIIKLLIKKGALDTTDGGDLLSDAAMNGQLDIVKLLVEEGGVSIHTADIEFNQLHYAVIGGNKELVKFLIEKGADFYAFYAFYAQNNLEFPYKNLENYLNDFDKDITALLSAPVDINQNNNFFEKLNFIEKTHLNNNISYDFVQMLINKAISNMEKSKDDKVKANLKDVISELELKKQSLKLKKWQFEEKIALKNLQRKDKFLFDMRLFAMQALNTLSEDILSVRGPTLLKL